MHTNSGAEHPRMSGWRRGLRATIGLGLFFVVFYATTQVCRSVFTTPSPAPLRPDPAAWTADGVHVTYVGHASVLISIRGTTILTDPAFFDRIGPDFGIFTVGPKRMVQPALALSDLPPIDVVVLSHAHMDSLDRPSLRAVEAPLLVTPRRTANLVDDLGYERVTELHWGESTRVEEIEIEAFEIDHWGKRWPWERWRGYNGYIFRNGAVAILFVSDTAYTRSIGRQSAGGELTAAVLGNGAYDPWVWNHATPEQVWQMYRESGARVLIPIHWDTFALGKEPPGDAITRLLAAAGPNADRIVIRRIGQTWSLNREQISAMSSGAPLTPDRVDLPATKERVDAISSDLGGDPPEPALLPIDKGDDGGDPEPLPATAFDRSEDGASTGDDVLHDGDPRPR